MKPQPGVNDRSAARSRLDEIEALMSQLNADGSVSGIRERFAARDLAATLRASDARKAGIAADRARCMGNAELAALLTAQAARRGVAVDWAEYFRNVGHT